MKKLVNVVILTLAMNFLAIAGGVGWLYQTHRVDREKVLAIKEILFPKPAEPRPTTEPSAGSEAEPSLRLDELLAKAAGRSALDQVEFMQSAFNAQMAQIERAKQELRGLQQSVELAKQQMTKDRAALEAQQKALDARQQQATRLANDKGFQDSLQLYNTMPSKQVKTVFMTLDDQTVLSYLQAMQPRTAARIVKEFKSPDEADRIQRILKQLAPSAQASIKE